MTTTMSVTDANPEIATRNRYFRAAVAKVHSWEPTVSVTIEGWSICDWRGPESLTNPRSSAARNGNKRARTDQSPAYHWSLGTYPSYCGSPIHPLILPTASMYRRPQIADASMAIAKISHATQFLSVRRG